MKYFKGSIIFTIIALVLAFVIGYELGGNIAAAMSAVFTAALLGVLETSLSFDNAVVNAKVLETMSPAWRKIFLTLGMLIAVGGMRIVFPYIITWAVSSNGFIDVIKMSIQNPQQFQKILVDQHILIAGFGGAFLWMVFTKFFFDAEKDEHWLTWLEVPMQKLGKVEAVWAGITMAVSFICSKFIPDGHGAGFLAASMLGIITYIVVEGLSGFLESGEEAMLAKGTVTKTFSAGLAAFIYLEVLDASFSFDGVIGAFAITNSLPIIALGLGIGAMFVRSLTIKLVDDKTLATYKFLEHGAFWAIGALSTIMYVSATGVEVPEIISGSIGIILIGLSLFSSITHNKSLQGA